MHDFCKAVPLAPFQPSSHSVLARCAVLKSLPRSQSSLGKVSKAQGCDSSALPTHTWLAALKSADSRDAVIVHWGSFVSRDLPLYATSPRLQYHYVRKSYIYRAKLSNRRKPIVLEAGRGGDRRVTPIYRLLR